MKDKKGTTSGSSALRPGHGRKAHKRELSLYHEDRLAVLGTMAAGIAHELNQPLNTIRVVTDGFLFGRTEGWSIDPEELFEGLEMISQQVARMDRVIRNIRNFSREERDAVGEGESVMANEAVENVFSMIGRQIEAHGIRVERDLDPVLPPLKVPLNELEQVVMNMIVNARQALDESPCTTKTLRVRTGSCDGAVWIEVSDNGGGIPDHLLKRIFDPFFTTKAAGKGTGLGLSISESIVSKFGGRIEVCNNESGGATFLVFVPAGEEQP
jgi:C4-dicarboxylate-specific signal transduction histidine kinase